MPDRVFLGFDPNAHNWRDMLPAGSNVVPHEDDPSRVTININRKKIVMTCFRLYDGRWIITWIKCDLVRLACGHSGISIDNRKVLFKVLTRYNNYINRFLSVDSLDRALPGLVPGCFSYYSTMEINLQLGRQHGASLEMFYNLKPKYAKKDTSRYDGQSVGHSSQHRKVVVYKKKDQLESRYRFEVDEGDADVCRIEFTLKTIRISKSFLLETGERIASFSLDDAYDAFMHNMREMLGVFSVPGDDAELTKPLKLLLKLMLDGYIPEDVTQAVSMYMEAAGLKPSAKADLERKLRKALANTRQIRIEDLLPEKIPESCQITPYIKCQDSKGNYTGETKAIKSYLDNTTIDLRIEEEYSSISTVPYSAYKKSMAPFIPSLNRMSEEELHRMFRESGSAKSKQDTQEEVQDGTPAHPLFPTPPKPC